MFGACSISYNQIQDKKKEYPELLREIKRSRDLFRKLVDTLPYGSALTDFSGNIIVGNAALAKFLNISVKSLSKFNLKNFFQLPDSIFSLIQKEKVLSFCFLGDRTCEITLYLNEKDAEEQEMIISWHIKDIHEFVSLQREYKELVESLPVGVFEATEEGEILYINATGKELLGIKKKKFFPDIIGKRNWKSLKEFKKKHIKLKNKKYLAFSLKKIDKDEFTNSPIFLGIFEDVSKEKELQEKLNRALIEAELANKAKTVFLAKMSHELRTPLNSILGTIFILEDYISHPKGKEFLNDLKSSAEYLNQLIGDLLDFSKIEAGKIELIERDFNLHQLLNNFYQNFKEAVISKGLEFRVKVDLNVPEWVKGDPVRIRQILSNLVSNSIKFTEKGGIYINVSYEGEKKGLHCIKFEVSDTGCGIPEDKLEKIFDPFEQAEAGREAGGTGLGLAIVKELVQLMHGEISVESKLGKGTTFYIKIFLKPGEPPSHLFSRPQPISNRTALIVDDVGLNRKVLRNILEREGWQITEASNGKEALDILSQKKFDIIFLDISMPVMDGWETVQHIKNHPELKQIPVIALTAHALVGDKERYLAAGFDGYIPKPFNPEILWREVGRLLKAETPAEEKKEIEVKKEAVDVDWDELVKTCQGAIELAKELLLDLVKEGEAWVREAEEAVNAGDEKWIRRVCHMIRGSAATVRAKRFEEAARRLGTLAKQGKFDQVPQALEELKQAYNSLKTTVESLVQ